MKQSEFDEQVLAELEQRGHQVSYNYPGYIEVVCDDGTFFAIGTANENWGGDLQNSEHDVIGGFETNISSETRDLRPLVDALDRGMREAKTVTVFALAKHILGREPSTGADFEEAGLPIMGGCQVCGASLAAYNAYPTKTGYLRCRSCLTDDVVWTNLETAKAEVFKS